MMVRPAAAAWQAGFAPEKLTTGSSGDYTGIPFKIVHPTAEGRTEQAAMDAFAAKKADPHVTIDGTAIFQRDAARAETDSAAYVNSQTIPYLIFPG